MLNALSDYIQTTKEYDEAKKAVLTETIYTLIKILAPITPHLCEELWENLGFENSVHEETFPDFNEEYTKQDSITLVLQINGKTRDKLEVDANISKEECEKIALQSEKVQKMLAGLTVKKVIVVPKKLVNIVAV